MQRPVEHSNNLEIAQVGFRQTEISSTVGEALSVTRLAHFSVGNNWQYLACGIDTLDLGISVVWGSNWDELTETFEQEKQRASGTSGIIFQDERCLMLPGGKAPNYRWHLQWPEFHLFIGKSRLPHGKTPNVYASINSRALWEMSASRAVERVLEVIGDLRGQVIAVKPSRCDLAADFWLPTDLTLDFLLSHRVPTNVKTSHILGGREILETFYQGVGAGSTQLRIYHKGIEIAKKGDKWWFLQVWNIANADHAWRVEFQLRRPTLKKFGIHTLDELFSQLGGLWKYLTEDWFSLRVKDNGNATRCSIHPWWQTVQACAEKFGQVRTISHQIDGEPADSSWYVSHCAGCLASFAAREGIDDLDTAGTLLFARIENHWRTRDFGNAVAVRSIPLGVPIRLGADDAELGSNGKDSEI